MVNPNHGCNEAGSEVREETDQGEIAKQNKTKRNTRNLLNSSQNQEVRDSKQRSGKKIIKASICQVFTNVLGIVLNASYAFS